MLSKMTPILRALFVGLMRSVFWCLLARNQPLTFVDLLPLVEKTANLHFLRCLLRFQPWFGHENGAIISFTNAARRDGANILWLLDFDWLLKSYDCLIFTFHWFISAG